MDENCKQNKKQTECLICSKNFLHCNDEKEEGISLKMEMGTTEDCRELVNQLEVVFLLRKVLDIPADICCTFLEDYGNPCTWLQCCNSCSVLVAKARNVFNQYEQFRNTLKMKVLNSGKSKKQWNSKEAGVNETVRYYVSQELTELSTSRSAISIKREHHLEMDLESPNEDCLSMQNYNSDEYHEDQDHSSLQSLNKFKISKSKRIGQKRRDVGVNKVKKEKELVNSDAEEDVNGVKRVQYRCTICQKSYCTLQKLKRHKLIHDKEKGVLPKTKKVKSVIRRVLRKARFSCGTCGKKYFLLASLKFHEKQIHSGEGSNVCEYCGKIFNRPESLRYHLKIHTGEKLYPCDFCGKSFIQISDLKIHLNGHTGEKPYSCEICGRQFRSSSNRSKHRLTHSGNRKRFPCPVCNKKYSRANYLSCHMKTHNSDGEAPCACEFCGKVFKLPSKLKKHMKLHTVRKQFICEICGKGFTSNGNLKVHKKIHGTIREFSCEICGKGFVQLNNLKIHINTHTTEKPYICDICGKSFRKQSYFKEHVKSHNEKNLHTCHTCGKQFKHSHHLLRHERFHTGEKPFICNICGKGFAQTSDLRRHEKTHLKSKKIREDFTPSCPNSNVVYLVPHYENI